MGDTGENENVRDPVGQVVQDLAAEAGSPGGERDHPVEHVEPEPDVAEDGPDE